MNFNTKIFGIFIFISLVLCITGVVSAVEDSVVQSPGNDSSMQSGSVSSYNDPGSMDIINNTDLRAEVLSNLESNGVNTSILKAAISVGASGKVKNILELYKDKLQANPGYVKPEQSEEESVDEDDESRSISKEPTPVPTGTKSPLSPLTALIGIGAAGSVAFLLKR